MQLLSKTVASRKFKVEYHFELLHPCLASLLCPLTMKFSALLFASAAVLGTTNAFVAPRPTHAVSGSSTSLDATIAGKFELVLFFVLTQYMCVFSKYSLDDLTASI